MFNAALNNISRLNESSNNFSLNMDAYFFGLVELAPDLSEVIKSEQGLYARYFNEQLPEIFVFSDEFYVNLIKSVVISQVKNTEDGEDEDLEVLIKDKDAFSKVMSEIDKMIGLTKVILKKRIEAIKKEIKSCNFCDCKYKICIENIFENEDIYNNWKKKVLNFDKKYDFYSKASENFDPRFLVKDVFIKYYKFCRYKMHVFVGIKDDKIVFKPRDKEVFSGLSKIVDILKLDKRLENSKKNACNNVNNDESNDESNNVNVENKILNRKLFVRVYKKQSANVSGEIKNQNQEKQGLPEKDDLFDTKNTPNIKNKNKLNLTTNTKNLKK